MSALAHYLLINLVQVTFLLVFAPLLESVLARLEEIIQGKRGPRRMKSSPRRRPGSFALHR